MSNPISTANLFEFIRSALPEGFDPGLLRSACPEQLWKENPKAAAAYALRHCPRLNWDAYLANYPDVAASGLEPAAHFLRSGIFEGRSLFVKRDVSGRTSAIQPLATIIIYNRDNAEYLEKTVRSALEQTLKNIEILAIDDGSGDDSATILKYLARQDARMRVLAPDKPESPRMARKRAVEIAAGAFIMFLDSGDFLAPNACEIATKSIGKGFDMASFGLNWMRRMETASAAAPALGAGEINEKAMELESAAHAMQNNLNAGLHRAIYEAGMCKKVFDGLENSFSSQMEDALEAFLLQRHAKKSKKENSRLYSVRQIERKKTALLEEDALGQARALMAAKGLNEYWEELKTSFLSAMFPAWLTLEDKNRAVSLFDNMAAQTGIYELLDFLVDNYKGREELVASQFRNYRAAVPVKEPKNIGILYTMLGGGGAEQVVMDLAALLKNRGYEVILFLGRPNERDADICPGAQIVYVGPPDETRSQFKYHLKALGLSLKTHPVDVMLCHACYFPELVWEIILLKYLRIPLILFPHSSFYSRLIHRGHAFTIQMQAAIFRCADKVSVLSIYDELYYRSLGVDALYIPNPVSLPEREISTSGSYEARRNNIVVLGRLHEPVKNMEACLRVMGEVVRSCPWATMTFTGSFRNTENRKHFDALVARYRLEPYVRVTGWAKDTSRWLDSAVALLSCAYSESFSLSIVEAQGRGLPAVIYDLPIMPAEENESIIRVAHGDYKAAADAILSLMDDEERWQRLSKIAREKAREFSGENYINRVISLLKTYDRQSEITWYRPRHYEVVMKTLGFYAAHVPPWLKKSA